MPFKNLPAWAKGGIIVTVGNIAFWLVFLVGASRSGGSDIEGFAILGGLYYGALSLIPAFILGSFLGWGIGRTLDKKGTSEQKGLKIGFFIGATFGVLWLVIWLIGSTFAPAAIVIPVIVLGVSSLLGWLIGKFLAE